MRTKKKFHCAHAAHAGNGSRRLQAQGAAGLKKRLPVLPTARWRARVTSSVVAVARLLFFENNKKFHCAHATQAPHVGHSLQPQFTEHKNTVQGVGATYLDRWATGNEVPNGSGAGPAVARPGSDTGSDAGTIETRPSMPDARLRFLQNITLS